MKITITGNASEKNDASCLKRQLAIHWTGGPSCYVPMRIEDFLTAKPILAPKSNAFPEPALLYPPTLQSLSHMYKHFGDRRGEVVKGIQNVYRHLPQHKLVKPMLN